MPERGTAENAIPLHQVLADEWNHQYPSAPISLAEIDGQRARFAGEHAAIEDPEMRADAVESDLVGEVYRRIHKSGVRRAALCFSGGGIRSATFGLGVVEGLARLRLLGKFDFLSTVSGGGYLGGWLSAWIKREGLAHVEARLADPPELPLQPEPPPISHLRSYSRYMSPRVGLLSADTWTLVAIFLRNLVLNWMVLLPLLAAGLMIPRVSVRLLRGWPDLPPWVAQALWGLGLLGGMVAVAYIIANRPSLTDGPNPVSRLPKRWRSQEWFLGLCLGPLLLMAVGSTLAWAWLRQPDGQLQLDVLGWGLTQAEAAILFGLVIHVGGYLLSRILVPTFRLGEAIGVVLTGGVGGWLLYLVVDQVRLPTLLAQAEAGTAPAAAAAAATAAHVSRCLELYAALASPIVLLLFLVAAILAVGLSSKYTSDADREWLARAGAWVLIAILVRSAMPLVVVFGTWVCHAVNAWVAGTIGGLSGLVTLIFGGSSKTKPSESGATQAPPSLSARLLDSVASLAAPLFALSIGIALSLATTLLVRWVHRILDPSFHFPVAVRGDHDPMGLLPTIFFSSGRAILLVAAGLLILSAIMGRYVDINRFSLHAAYRDRLIRAYLGASRDRGTRKPNPFTGFDPADNLPMAELKSNRPLHVVNMALNLVHGENLAWQDRKAETFTVTPMYSGNFRLGYRPSDRYGLHEDGKSAISLGTAVAISGAAASPNMGYHSSPVVTFLLALFNVRLGWWLGNPGPAGEKTWQRPGPRFAQVPLMAEAFGLTDDENAYVYLSDGGHFENLGLYEMVLRRCQLIVLSDSGQDADFGFEDLGNAVAKIRIDLGVPIEFDKLPMHPRRQSDATYDVSTGQAAFPYCALGRIRYSCVDYLEKPGDLGSEIDGWVLYIKPSLNGTEPVDVFNYAKKSAAFPHESTADQLYTEAQFESYRALGSHALRDLSAGFPTGGGLEELRASAEKYIEANGASRRG